jgi:hypothetical protein
VFRGNQPEDRYFTTRGLYEAPDHTAHKKRLIDEGSPPHGVRFRRASPGWFPRHQPCASRGAAEIRRTNCHGYARGPRINRRLPLQR